VLTLLYVLQICIAEMLRHAYRGFGSAIKGPGIGSQVAGLSCLLVKHVHPVAMAVLGVGLATMAIAMVRGVSLPRWTFDGMGLWFVMRLLAEYITINGLIFEGSCASAMSIPAGRSQASMTTTRRSTPC